MWSPDLKPTGRAHIGWLAWILLSQAESRWEEVREVAQIINCSVEQALLQPWLHFLSQPCSVTTHEGQVKHSDVFMTRTFSSKGCLLVRAEQGDFHLLMQYICWVWKWCEKDKEICDKTFIFHLAAFTWIIQWLPLPLQDLSSFREEQGITSRHNLMFL